MMIKGRKIFTSLSIVIGISSIIIIFSITHTTKSIVTKDIQNMGADILELSSGIMNRKGEKIGSIADEDLRIIKARCKNVRRIAITIYSDDVGQDIRIVEKERKRELGGLVVLQGTLPSYKEIMGLSLAAGRFINDMDIKLKRRVCVLGYYTYLRFGGKKCIGKSIEILGPTPLDSEGIPIGEPSYLPEKFTIVGALQRRLPLTLPGVEFFADGFSEWITFDTNIGVFIPYSTMKEIAKIEDDLKFIWLQMKIKEEKTLSKNEEEIIYDESIGGYLPKRINKEGLEIINILKEKYGPDKKFYLSFAIRLLDELESQAKHANTFIGIIGTISLLVSIISILNMMLLSVNKRISEIGIRRAFGARKRDIFLQFLIETLRITGIGGIMGIILGIIGTHFIGYYTRWEMIVPWYSVILSACMTMLIGIIGGLYPAMKAANIPPAQAVKYE